MDRIVIHDNEEPKRKILVIKDGDEILSLVELIIIHDIFGKRPCAYIHKVYTIDREQGKGYASRLVKEAIRYAKNQGCYKVFLICKEDLIPFYNRLRFEKDQVSMRYLLK